MQNARSLPLKHLHFATLTQCSETRAIRINTAQLGWRKLISYTSRFETMRSHPKDATIIWAESRCAEDTEYDCGTVPTELGLNERDV